MMTRFTAMAAVLSALLACTSPSSDSEVNGAPSALLEEIKYFDSIVVFQDQPSVARLASLGRSYKTFRVLPMARVLLSTAEMGEVRGWAEVRRVVPNHRLHLLNAEGRALTRSDEVVASLGYDGTGVQVAVIDTGADGLHPDLASLRDNWEVTGNFIDDTQNDGVLFSLTPDGLNLETSVVNAEAPLGVGVNTDEYGHGTHVIGTIGGSGAASDGLYRGMAPGATIDSYSTSGGIAVLWPLEAYDHIIDSVRAGRVDIKIISNSWGSSACGFDPLDPINVASRIAYEHGILSVYAYGNDGPTVETCNPYASAPYVLGIGATDKVKYLTGFSSRGIPGKNYDREAALQNVAAYLATSKSEQSSWDFTARPVGVFRPSIVAPGDGIVSAQNPVHPMTLSGGDYGAASGTSMATPMVSGVAALAIDAYESTHPGARLSPIDLIRLLEVTANKDAMFGFDTYEVGAGFVDAKVAADRAVAGNIPTAVTSADLVSLNWPPNVKIEATPISGTVAVNSWGTNSGFVIHEIPVSAGALALRATVEWATELDKIYLTLYKPGVDPSSTANAAVTSAGLLDVLTSRSVEFRFPEAGVWKLRVDGRVNLAATSYTGKTEVIYPENSKPTGTISATPTRVSGGESVSMSATVSDPDGATDITSATVVLRDGRGKVRRSWALSAFTASGSTLSLSASGLSLEGPAPWTFVLTAKDSAGQDAYAQTLVSKNK